MKHLTKIASLTDSDIKDIFDMATAYAKTPFIKVLNGTVMANLFYEPSTRTSSSFAAAALRLSASVIGINEVNYSSVVKGETLEDTIRTLGSYADIIVLRHPNVGAADRAASVSPVPIINAGDGHGEHPTQALLDAFTIAQRHDINVPLHVGFVGDLKYGRTVHSLINLLPRLVKNLHIHLIAPDEVQMVEDEFSIPVKKHHIKELPNIIPQLDVLYATRIQKERFSGSSDLEYCITKNMMDMAKPTLSLMHPLPRNSEIPTEIDTDPRAAYFEQMKNGMFIRMAILSWILR